MATLALPLTSLVSPAWSVPGRLHRSTGLDAVRLPIVETTESGRSAPVTATRIWIGGSGIVALYFLSGYARLARLRQRARPAPPAWKGAVERLSARRRLTRQVEVLVSESVRGPLVTGVGRVAVLIPPEACFWSENRRDAVLIHELAHVGRGDLTAQLAAPGAGDACTGSIRWPGTPSRDAARARAGVRRGSPPARACRRWPMRRSWWPLPLPAMPIPSRPRRCSMARRSELEGRLTCRARPPATTPAAWSGCRALAADRVRERHRGGRTPHTAPPPIQAHGASTAAMDDPAGQRCGRHARSRRRGRVVCRQRDAPARRH